MLKVLFTLSVFQLCLGAVNRLLHSYIQNQMPTLIREKHITSVYFPKMSQLVFILQYAG